MKKIRFIVFLVLAFTFKMCVALAAVPAKPSTFSYAYDFAGSVFSESDKKTIAEYGEALFKTTGDQVIAVVVSSFDGINEADYSTDLINKWGIGSADKNNGVVVLLSTGDRKIRIGTGTGIDRVMTGGKAGSLINDNLNYFSTGNYSRGMISLYKDVCNYLANARGKSLSITTSQTTSSSDSRSGSSKASSDDERIKFELFLTAIQSLILFYVLISVTLNVMSRRRGHNSGCFHWFFLGWLLNRQNHSLSRGRYVTLSELRQWRRDGSGMGYGSSSDDNSSGGWSSSSDSSSGGSFGGGSSRGGGAGASF